MDIYLEQFFKPVATLMQSQQTIDNKGNIVELKGKGRHDPCVVPRLFHCGSYDSTVLADFYLQNQISK